MARTTIKQTTLAAVILLGIVMPGCKTHEAYVVRNTPFHPFVTEHSRVSYVSAPPMMQPPVKVLDEITISCQYFKIVVPIVLDKTGKLEAVKNLIDEQFTTALDATKRFEVMEKTTVLNIMKQQYEANTYSNSGAQKMDMTTTKINKSATTGSQVSNTASMTPKDGPRGADISNRNSKGTVEDSFAATVSTRSTVVRNDNSVTDYYGLYETHPEEYQNFLDAIAKYSDGILKIVLTGNDEERHQIDVDYRIISSLSQNKILYSGSGKIGYTLEKGSATKNLVRDDIEKIANEIKQQFPNPDVKTFQITELHGGNKITANAGKNDNIKEGMVGYVIKDKSTRLAYRAMFEVTEVFASSFNGEMKVESPEKLMAKGVTEQDRSQYDRIINTIKVGEQVKMK